MLSIRCRSLEVDGRIEHAVKLLLSAPVLKSHCVDGVDSHGGGVAWPPAMIWAKAAGRHDLQKKGTTLSQTPIVSFYVALVHTNVMCHNCA